MYINEFGHEMYTPQEMQEEFKKLQNKIDNDSELRNRMSKEKLDYIHSIANMDLAKPVSRSKKKSGFGLMVVLMLAVVGLVIYFGL